MQREPKTRNHSKCIVGIDVSKAVLDVCILPDNKQLQFPNDKLGHKKLIMELSGQEVSKIVLEATGIYHVRLHQALEGAGFCVAIVNPYRSRKFADVCGQLAKTDRIDARILAVFAQTIDPPVTPAPSELMLEIKMLSAARTSLIMDQTALKNRIEAAESPYLKDLYRKRLEDLKNDIKALEKEILDLIRGDETYKRYFQILTSIPGIGNICAIVLVAGMRELGRASNKEIAALVGVAPLNWDSGTMRGKRGIRGGRHVVRKALYMPALSVATREDSRFSIVYQGMIKRGKPAKVALVAIMRKLIIVANTLIRKNVLWDPDFA